MARWFRSEPMEYISLIVNEDAAHDCLADLGNMGAIQFTDVSLLVIFRSIGALAITVSSFI
jgi:vacuolar-type H+-ATPase subunit I/STV1